MKREGYRILAWVVLSDHLHAVWQLPEGDANYPMRWGLIKSKFSRRIPNGERIRDSRKKQGERGIWQRRFWEHLIQEKGTRKGDRFIFEYGKYG